MARIDDLLAEYGESHQNPVNKLLHWICVPLIVWSLLGLLWSIPGPAVFSVAPLLLNWAVLVTALAMIYYLMVSPRLSVGILLVFIIMLVVVHSIDQAGARVWLVTVIVFILAWVGQFIGHGIEGKRPSFFKDIQFLLIGPLWLLSFVYRKLGIQY